MRVLLVYDCLFPHTVGGAERWYRNLGERLAADGHDVSYLTLRQWDRGVDPGVPGVRVVLGGPRMGLYASGGRRRTWPPIVFGAGVLWHLLRYGRRYDVVHTASFPYFSLLAAALVRPLGGYRLVVDWHELWTRSYWREYLGPIGGRVGWAVQRACARVPQRAFCFAGMTARRLHDEGLNGEVTVLEGEYDGPLEGHGPEPAPDVVVFAGRHIREKRAPALVPAIALARERIPGLRAVLYGDGPERAAVEAAIDEHGLRDVISAPGFVPSEQLDAALRSALCMVLPSRREGYGMIVIESSAAGTPAVVVAGEDNAATELVDPGVNGIIAPSAEPADLAAAILAVHEQGMALRERTAAWFAENADRRSLRRSLDHVVEAYRG
jgi:glycosyltransferase involved in cell wall biosynthesis